MKFQPVNTDGFPAIMLAEYHLVFSRDNHTSGLCVIM